jgi:hypothetical protein
MLHEGELAAGARVTLAQNTMMVLKRVLPGRGSWRASSAALPVAAADD